MYFTAKTNTAPTRFILHQAHRTLLIVLLVTMGLFIVVTPVLAQPEVETLALGRIYIQGSPEPTGYVDINICPDDITPQGYLNVLVDLSGNGCCDVGDWVVQDNPIATMYGEFSDQNCGVFSLTYDLTGISAAGSYDVYAAFTLDPSVTLPDPGDMQLTTGVVFETYDIDDLLDGAINNGLDAGARGRLPDRINTRSANRDPGGMAIYNQNRGIIGRCRTDIPGIKQGKNECGPTSAAQSLLWLQGRQGLQGLPAQAELIDDLKHEMEPTWTTGDYPGISPANFAPGKAKVLKDHKLNNTVATTSGGQMDGTGTFEWIKKQIEAGADVELRIQYPGDGGHWVTVAGWYDDGTTQRIFVKDPLTGGDKIDTYEIDGTTIKDYKYGNPAELSIAVAQNMVATPSVPKKADDKGKCQSPTSGGPSAVDDRGDFQDTMGGPSWDGWQPLDRSVNGIGNFGQLWPALQEIDPCLTNTTTQVAFIDDGIIVPGTGGTLGMTHQYGPAGFIVNPVGGLGGPDHHLSNEIWSPPFGWPDPNQDGAILEFDVFIHEDLRVNQSPGMFGLWRVRSTDDPAGETGWSAWRDRDYAYYGGPSYLRLVEDVSDLLLPGRTHVQIALGVKELGYLWGFDGLDGAPAPYFDNVDLHTYPLNGPAMHARDIDLSQDDFPDIGDIDCLDACANHVRFDMAQDISGFPPAMPGDSIVVNISAVRAGSELTGMPELCYHLSPNPIFAPCRGIVPPGAGNTPTQGCTPGYQVITANGDTVAGRYAFDLPDTGFFWPGDIIHYYFRATDTSGGTTTLPGDTTGFSAFPGDPDYVMSLYQDPYVVRALPTIHSLSDGECTQPSTLWWRDSAHCALLGAWMQSWRAIGYEERDQFDIYVTNEPSAGVGNGLGGRATSIQLSGYEMIAYSSGDQIEYTITGANTPRDVGDDFSTLLGWLDSGDRCLFLTGNNLACDLYASGDPAGTAFAGATIQVSLLHCQHVEYLGHQWNPSIEAVPLPPSNPLFINAGRWAADGFCNPTTRYFDLVSAYGSPGKVASWLSPPYLGCTDIAPDVAAAVYNNLTNNNRVIYLPYDLGYVITDTQCGGWPVAGMSSIRSEILRDVAQTCEQITSYPSTDVPDLKSFTVSSFPNPFNPNLLVSFVMPAQESLSIKIYNVRGEYVTTLIEGIVPAGPGKVTWDSRDDNGAAVSSGVYFCVAEFMGQVKIEKIALVK